jgi:16S rRNA processing protein RimM
VTDPTKVLLGRITGAHGIRGDVTVASWAGVPEDIAAYGPLSSSDGRRLFTLKVVRVTPKGVIAHVQGVNDRNAAEALSGTDLFVARDRLPAATGDEFYHSDLIGIAAVSPDGVPVGTIVGVDNFGAGDLIEIRLEGSSKTEFVPFSDAFVPEIDVAARRAVIRLVIAPDDGPGDGEKA